MQQDIANQNLLFNKLRFQTPTITNDFLSAAPENTDIRETKTKVNTTV